MTAWGREFRHACQRMDRGLREFRVRGVKTNIPFLENVVNHRDFQAGQRHHRWLEETPELFRFTPRRDRATKLLTYLADVIVNGNPTIAGKPCPTRLADPARSAATTPRAPPDGTRQRLLELGPEGSPTGLASSAACSSPTPPSATRTSRCSPRASAPTTCWRSRTSSRIACTISSASKCGAARPSTSPCGSCTRTRSRASGDIREAIPNICFQMLLRASNAVGLHRLSRQRRLASSSTKPSAQGIDIFRIFDSLNWLPNMKVVDGGGAQDASPICEAAICYTGDILDPKRDKYSLEYYVKMAKELERMGAHILAIKDMAGLCRPYAAEKLVKALRQEIGIPIHFHTHDTSGINAASVLKAADAGVHIADGAIASMSGQTSQPNLNSIVAALDHTKRDTGLDLDALNQCADYWEVVREYYAPFDTGPKSGTAEVYLHEMPGGQYTNLKEQAESMGLGARWHEIARTYADVNIAFGDIVKVTPSSKVVGDMAIFLVNHNMTMEQFAKLGPDHNLTLPASVIDMFMGSLGEPDGGWPKKLQKIILRGAKPQQRPPRRASCRRSISTRPRRSSRRRSAASPSRDEVLSYLMYPDVFLKFATRAPAAGAMSTCCRRRRSTTGWSAARTSPWSSSPARRWSSSSRPSASRTPTAPARSSSS